MSDMNEELIASEQEAETPTEGVPEEGKAEENQDTLESLREKLSQREQDLEKKEKQVKRLKSKQKKAILQKQEDASKEEETFHGFTLDEIDDLVERKMRMKDEMSELMRKYPDSEQDIDAYKKIAEEKDITLSQAYILVNHDKLVEKSTFNQQKSRSVGLHGKFSKPSSPESLGDKIFGEGPKRFQQEENAK